MVLLHIKKEIINKKELNKRIEVIKKAKNDLETNDKILWAGEDITDMDTLYNRAVEVIGKKYAKRIFKKRG